MERGKQVSVVVSCKKIKRYDLMQKQVTMVTMLLRNVDFPPLPENIHTYFVFKAHVYTPVQHDTSYLSQFI